LKWHLAQSFRQDEYEQLQVSQFTLLLEEEDQLLPLLDG
jgi:hypothetical protein